jgi:chemotaxis-related protein WspD
MNNLPLSHSPGASPRDDCWNRIGVTGDRSCPELVSVLHCRNCSVFTAAGRQFLDASPPPGYLEEWAQRLALPLEEPGWSGASATLSVLVFRLGEEWLALPVAVLVEVASTRAIHRIPHRAGLLAGLVNIRGELLLCTHLDRLLGIGTEDSPPRTRPVAHQQRFLVVQRESPAPGNATERWVFPVHEVDQVRRFSPGELREVPITLGEPGQHLTRGVFHHEGRAIGYLDAERLFQTLRARVR